VYLPAAAPGGKAASCDNTEELPCRGNELILLVEDEAAVRAVARAILESYGYGVIEADCAASALKAWHSRTAKINLLLTDVIMPGGITGRALAETIASEDENVRCLFTSGYPAEILGKDFRLREGINYLRKPYGPRSLLHSVRQCLDSTRAD
jgi:two-component system cell cycle sensor histidine kinase/response regulator CckA